MRVAYTPEDNPEAKQSWVFRPGRVRQSEAALIERQYGQNWDKFCADVQAGNIAARRVLLWHLIRREHPKLRLEDTPDFYADEVVVSHSPDELREIRTRVVGSGLPAAEVEVALAVIDQQIAAAEADAEPEQSEGKATSSSEH